MESRAAKHKAGKLGILSAGVLGRWDKGVVNS